MSEPARIPASLSPAHRPLLERLIAILRRDDRVAALLLSGSLARGDGDEHADIDLHLVARDDRFDSLAAAWSDLVDAVGPTFLRRRLPGPTPIVTVVDRDWRRYDLVFHRASDLERWEAGPTLALYDPQDLGASIRAAVPPAGNRLAFLVEEFLRVLGLFPVVAARDEGHVALEGALLLKRMLVDLMLLENAVGARGVKRVNPLLTTEQRAILDALGPYRPTIPAVGALNHAIAADFLPRARRLCATHGVTFPEEFAAATLARLDPS